MHNYKIVYQATDNLLRQAIALDNKVFNKWDAGNFDVCRRWLSINKDIYTFLLDGEKCVGYINFIRISDKCFEEFRHGNMKDYNLQNEDILPFEKGENKCLFMSIAIDKDYRDTDAIICLRKGFDDKLNEFKKRGIFIKDVVIDCVSTDGAKYAIERLNAKFIKNSKGGKIYYSKDIFAPTIVPKISLELLSQSNLKEVALMQYNLFKDYWCGYTDFIRELQGRKNDLPVTYLIKYQGKSVGIVGLYQLDMYPDVIWLNWLGVLPQYRRLGIGTHALFKIIEIAKQYKRNEFRLVTYKVWNNTAQHIYHKIMQRSEYYTNCDDWQKGIKEGKAMIFSSSLIDKKISKWKNKYIDLNSDIILHNESIKKLKEDHLID